MRLSIRSSRCRPLGERRKYSAPRRATSAETDLPTPVSGPRSASAIETSAEEEKEPPDQGGRPCVMIGQPYRELDLRSDPSEFPSGGFHGKKQRCRQEAERISTALAKAAGGGCSTMRTSSAKMGGHEEDRLLITFCPRHSLASKVGTAASSISINHDPVRDQPVSVSADQLSPVPATTSQVSNGCEVVQSIPTHLRPCECEVALVERQAAPQCMAFARQCCRRTGRRLAFSPALSSTHPLSRRSRALPQATIFNRSRPLCFAW